MTIDEILREVATELVRARQQQAPMHSAHEGWAVIYEEVEELWHEVKSRERTAQAIEAMRKEAIQVAAMAVAFVLEVCEAKLRGVDRAERDASRVFPAGSSSVEREILRDLHPGVDF